MASPTFSMASGAISPRSAIQIAWSAPSASAVGSIHTRFSTASTRYGLLLVSETGMSAVVNFFFFFVYFFSSFCWFSVTTAWRAPPSRRISSAQDCAGRRGFRFRRSIESEGASEG